MAIYKPTDCSPFNGTFDLSSDLPIIFECKIDTSNSPVTGYSIEIYNSNNEIIFPDSNRTTGPIESNVTYLTDLKEYVKNKFPSLVSNIRNVNSGLNGTVLEIPAIVNSSDVDNNTTVGRNQIRIVSGETNILVDGQTYMWKITLYQEVENGTKKTFPPAEEKFYDMTVASGTVIGSNEKRIQTALIDSDDKVVDNLVLIDKFVQPIKIDGFNRYDPSNPVKSWTGTVPTTFTMTRSLITGYDSTYGYVYPSTAEGNAFANGQIVPENANGFQIFKNGNDPSNLGATDMVEFIYNGEFRGKMTWKTSAANPEQSYWEQTYLVNSDPNGVFYPLKGDGYSSFALTGSERIIFNNIQKSKVQYDKFYYGSPYNGIFEPHFSSKKALNNNIIAAGTYTFKQILSLPSDVIEQDLRFITTQKKDESTTILKCNKIEITSGVVRYVKEQNNVKILAYFIGTDGWYNDGYQTIILESDQEVSSDFFKWFSQNANVSTTSYQVTVTWNRTTDAANWGALSNKIIYCRRDGKNYEINTTTQVGEINKTPFKFVEEKPVKIFNTATVETQNQITGDDSESNPRIFHTSKAISSILSVTNNNGVDITKDCAFEVGKNYIIYTSSSAIPSDLTISVKYIPFNIQDYTGIIFYNKQSTPDSDAGIIYIRPSISINKNMIFKEVTTTAKPTWFNINYFNKDYNYITYTGNQGFSPEIDKTRYQIKSFYKDSDYNPFSIYKNPEIATQIETGNKIEIIQSDGVVNNVETMNFTVRSNYSQNSYIQWKSYQWILYDSAKRTILEKTEESYSGEILGNFYGLEPQQYYILSLILQTNSGKIIEVDYVIYTDFAETTEQRDLVQAEFDCDTLSMKSSLKFLDVVLAPDANNYLPETPSTAGTAYYYNLKSNFYKKDNQAIASVNNNGVLTITGQNSLDFSKSFENYAINSNTRTGDIQIDADEIVVEGSFDFSEDYSGDIFSVSRGEEGTGTIKISIPKAIKSIDSDGFVTLSDDINKVQIGGSNSYLRIIGSNGIVSNSNEWQDSSEFHNTSIWQVNGTVPNGDRINVANFQYAEVDNEDGTYDKNTYLNIAGPFNTNSDKAIRNPMGNNQQSFSFYDNENTAMQCKNGDQLVPFRINQPDKLIWVDNIPAERPKSVVINANGSGAISAPRSVLLNEALIWNDDIIWKDGTYLENGTGLSAKIGEVRVNGMVVEADTVSGTDPTYTNTGLVKQEKVSMSIKEREALSGYNLSFRIFINTNNFTIDQLRSACFVERKYAVNFAVNWNTYESGRMGTVKFLYANGTNYTSVDNNLNGKSFTNVVSVTFEEREGEYWSITYRVDGNDYYFSLGPKAVYTLTLTGDTTFISFTK